MHTLTHICINYNNYVILINDNYVYMLEKHISCRLYSCKISETILQIIQERQDNLPGQSVSQMNARCEIHMQLLMELQAHVHKIIQSTTF